MWSQVKRISRWIGVVAILSGLLAGCMTERSPIDTTSALGLDKRLFEGEWFYKQTITDLPYSVDYSFIGETNDLRIIRWEITENWLIGYSIHEEKEIVDTEGTRVPAKTPIIAYPIRSHFDRQLAENATTGEDLPMLVENRDKPWWQRRYFEIDPAGSAITNFEMKYMNLTIDWENPFYIEPVGGYRNLEFHDQTGKAINPLEYEMRYMAGEDQLVDTMSFFQEMIFSPNNDWRHIYTWEDVIEFIDWEPARIEYRHFFWKLDREKLDNNGFEPMEFQDEMFRRFGYFVREYRGVDPQHGYRENNIHYWANYFNISGDNKIVYYLGPDFPEKMALAACSIGADYNYAFSKAKYEGEKAKESAANGEDFSTDFPNIIKLQDGLNELPNQGLSNPTSLFMPDANTPWPDDLKLDDSQYYYLDYTIESLNPPTSFTDDDASSFVERRDKMVAEMKRYCFHEDDNDVFQLRRNEFLEYDYDRDGVNPEGLPNLITPEEIYEKYGDDVNTRVAREVNYPVACKATLEHRCAIDTNGHKIPRYKVELGDPRYSMIYWVDTPTEYGILGVAQWSDNPETGQLFSGVGHIAGSVLQWSVSRELERYFMIDELRKNGFEFDDGEHYKQVLDDLIIDAEYTARPRPGEEGDLIEDEVNPPPLGPAREGYSLSAAYKAPDVKPGVSMLDKLTQSPNVQEDKDYLEYLESKKLPHLTNRFSMESIRGTKWEALMSPQGFLDDIYPGRTSFNEEMLYGISPVYWGTAEGMSRYAQREIEFTKGCYFQSEWLDGGFLEIIERLDKSGYTREQIRHFIERVMFKGVAEHEVGHALGLRHNFMGSADELNYVGSNGTVKQGYWKFNDSYVSELDGKVKDFEEEKGRDITPIEKFYLSKTIATPRDWYMYTSVMDYMDEFYFHGFGLGRYDLAAFLYTYGKAIEKYKFDSDGNIAYNPVTGNPIEVIEPLFEYRYCNEGDLYNSVCSCVPGMPKDGANDEDCICTEKEGLTYCYNQAQPVNAIRTEVKVKLVENGGGKVRAVPVEGERTDVQLNGDARPYMYCPDHWRYDHPMCNVWDKGYTGREIIRNMAEQFKRFYFWRNFRRGNPKFRRMWWVEGIWRMWPFAHFALDFNYNRSQLEDWLPLILDNNEDPFPKDGNIPLARKEYLLAINGIEEWTETDSEGHTVKKELTPGGPGDYLIAGMEGFNFLLYDVLYSPDVGVHVLSNWFTDGNKQYFETNPYVLPDEEVEDMEDFTTMTIDYRYGHQHRNRWDRQEDLSITESRLMIRGFTDWKDAASYLLTNSGWWMEKYMFESMANAFHYTSDGFENALYHMMENIMNEDAMTTFSRYCAELGDDGQYHLKVFQPRVNETYLWNWAEDAVASNSDWQPGASDPTLNLCQKAALQTGKEYIPVHASWIYFDKIWPALYSTVNMANTMADNTIFWYYMTEVISADEHDLYEPVDGVRTIECLNSKENKYYRAFKDPNDDRPNPIFDLVSRCNETQKRCLMIGQTVVKPGALDPRYCNGADGFRYPRSYINRELETIESTMILLNDFSSFWLGTITGNYR